MSIEMADEYHGWANRETWACHLWLTNDEGLYTQARTRVRAAFDERCASLAEKYPEWNDQERTDVAGIDAGGTVREVFDEWISDLRDDDECNDVINVLTDVGSLWRVEWEDVAAAFLGEDE
jgi:hypothetical protein